MYTSAGADIVVGVAAAIANILLLELTICIAGGNDTATSPDRPVDLCHALVQVDPPSKER
jgi:hypothetical protein